MVILSGFGHSLTRTKTGTLIEVGATAGTFLSRKMGSWWGHKKTPVPRV